jgi:hypothetical protein
MPFVEFHEKGKRCNGSAQTSFLPCEFSTQVVQIFTTKPELQYHIRDWLNRYDEKANLHSSRDSW